MKAPRKEQTEKRVTLRTLAKELEVSPATVLRALSGHPSVRPELRKKITKFAAQNGYRLPGKHTGNVAVVTEGSCFSGYLALLLTRLFEELQKRGFHVFILPEPDTVSFSDVMYDGIISTTWFPGFEKMYPKNHSLPLVCVNTLDNRIDNVYMVSSDEFQGISMGLQHLYNAGCRHILYAYPAATKSLCFMERLNAFRKFCLDRELPCREMEFPQAPEEMVSTARKALVMGIDGVFVPSEWFSMPIMNAFLKAGARIPDDISVAGLEMDLESCYFQPALTAVRQDFEGLARESVKMLKKLISGKRVTKSVRLPYQLIQRESVRK